MSTKALRKELLAAIAMVIVAAIALSGSTYAWFAVNNIVTATGMTVKTQVSNNLFIAGDELAAKDTPATKEFKTAYVTSLKALLQPTSTTSGKADEFWYTSTTNVKGLGDVAVAEYKDYDVDGLAAANDTTTYYNAFSENAAVTKANASAASATDAALGYVDYVFQLKAVNTGNNIANVNVTDLNLVYGNNTTTGISAFRTAILAEEIASETTAPQNDFLPKSILKPAEGSYFTNNSAVKTASTVDAVDNLNAKAVIGTVPAGATKYFKVVVRLWLEGEDRACNNGTFASLNDSWALDVKMVLEEGNTNAITAMDTSTNEKTNMSGATIDDSQTAVIDGVNYYKTNKQVGGEDVYSSTNPVAAGSRYFVIRDAHPIEVTNQTKFE